MENGLDLSRLKHLLMSSACTPEAVDMLIAGGLDPMQSSRDGYNPLMCAINRRASLDVVKKLLPEQLDKRINARNVNGDTALNLAVLVYDGQSIGDLPQMLRDAGADFSMRPATGKSLISMALRNKYSLKQIRFLVDSGAHISGVDIGEALKLSRLEVVRILLDNYTTNSDEPLNCILPNALSLLVNHFDAKLAYSSQLLKIFKRLLFEFKLDANYADATSLPVLHLLILKWKKQFNVLLETLLLVPGIDIDVCSGASSITPLTLALKQGLNRVAEKLILHHADVSKASVQHMTLSPGLSAPLKLLQMNGYKFPEVFGHLPPLQNCADDLEDTSNSRSVSRPARHDISRELTLNELKNFKEWLKGAPAFPSLQTLAANRVRPLYRVFLAAFQANDYPKHFQEQFTRMVFLEL